MYLTDLWSDCRHAERAAAGDPEGRPYGVGATGNKLTLTLFVVLDRACSGFYTTQ